MKLSLFILTVLVSTIFSAELEFQVGQNGNPFVATADLGTKDFSFTLPAINSDSNGVTVSSPIIEVPVNSLDDFDFSNVDETNLLTQLVEANVIVKDFCKNFTARAATTYSFDLLADQGEKFQGGEEALINCGRNNFAASLPTFAFFRKGQVNETINITLSTPGKFGLTDEPLYELQVNETKFEIAAEWPQFNAVDNGPSAILMQFMLDYNVELFKSKNFWSQTSFSLPKYDIDTLEHEDGSFAGIAVTFKKAEFKIFFPKVPVLSFDSPSIDPPDSDANLTPLPDVDFDFKIVQGKSTSESSKTDISGRIYMYLIVNAKNTNTSEPVDLPGRFVVDPVFKTKSSASALNSWASLLQYFF